VTGDPIDAGVARHPKATEILLEKSYFSIARCFFPQGLRFRGTFTASNDAADSQGVRVGNKRLQARTAHTLDEIRAFPKKHSRKLSRENMSHEGFSSA
jgi:hypothetical protein